MERKLLLRQRTPLVEEFMNTVVEIRRADVTVTSALRDDRELTSQRSELICCRWGGRLRGLLAQGTLLDQMLAEGVYHLPRLCGWR